MRNLKIAMAVMLLIAATGCTKNANKQSTTKMTTELTTETTTAAETTEEKDFVETKTIDSKAKGQVVSVGNNSDHNFVILKCEDGKRIGLFVDNHMKITWEDSLDQKLCKQLFDYEYSYCGLGETKLVEVTLTKEIRLRKEFEEELDENVEQWYWADSAHVLELSEYAGMIAAKPVIYLYPEREMDVQVQLNYQGKLTTTYPEYPKNGWSVTAKPDGTLIDKVSKKEYSYLFWEGEDAVDYDMTEGFVVAGKDIAAFLQDKLSYMGLTPKEYNEFIVYWLPKMQNNSYNLIKFQGKQYTENAELKITPQPDSMLRVFMTWKALDEAVEVQEQKLKPFERKGFTVVEWGGSELED